MFPDELNKNQGRKLKEFLEFLYRRENDKFNALFLQEEIIRGNGADLGILEDAALVERTYSGYKSRVRIFPYHDKFIVTDFPSLLEIDRVFPTDEEGSGYLADHLNIAIGDVVLDLGTGSGIFAIFCANSARKVIATDTSPKALAYARFNAALNGVENKIEFLCGDLFEPVKGQRFDLIVSNPPPVPVPPDTPFYIHSDGGPNGLGVFSRILNQIVDYMRSACKLQFVMLSLGSGSNPLIVDVLKSYLGRAKLRIALTALYPKPIDIDPHFLSLFKEVDKSPEWEAYLKKEGFAWLDCFFIDICFSNEFAIGINYGERIHSAFAWKKRMAKYVLPSSAAKWVFA